MSKESTSIEDFLLIMHPDAYKCINVGPPPKDFSSIEENARSRYLRPTQINTMKRTDTISSIGPDDRIPTDRYNLCVRDISFRQSAAGNPMIVSEFEVMSDANGSDTIQVGDRTFNVAGIRITQYYPLTVLDKETGAVDEVKSKKARGRVFDLYDKCGCPQEDIDENNPDIGILRNKGVAAILRSKANTKTKSLTAEEIAAGKKVGAPILGNDGKPMQVWRVEIDSLIGPVDLGINQPY